MGAIISGFASDAETKERNPFFDKGSPVAHVDLAAPGALRMYHLAATTKLVSWLTFPIVQKVAGQFKQVISQVRVHT
jgi:hypothetical protein